MKIIYLFISIYFFIKIVTLYFNNISTKDEITKQVSTTPIKAIDFSLNIKEKNYLFSDAGWNMKRKKEEIISTDNKSKDTIEPIVLHLNQKPVTLCDKNECYEFLALKDNYAIFYGKTDNNTSGFIELQKNDFLTNRILLKSIQSKTIELFDTEFNTTLKIHMFDLNISKYTSTNTKEKKYETK